MKLKKSLIYPFLIVFCVVLLGVFNLSNKEVSAAPDTYCYSSAPSTGTSSPIFLTPGGTVATTTVYASAGCATSMYGLKSIALGVQFMASSSVSILVIQQEYAQSPNPGIIDCISTPTACDWYGGTFTTVNDYSTTTSNLLNLDVVPVPTYTWDFASSTVGGVPITTGMTGPNGTNNRDAKILTFIAPTQYTRFIFSLKTITNGNGAVAVQVIGKKEIGER